MWNWLILKNGRMFCTHFYSACGVGGEVTVNQWPVSDMRSIRWNLHSPWGWVQRDSPNLSRLGTQWGRMRLWCQLSSSTDMYLWLWQGEVLQLELINRALTVGSCTRFDTLPKIANFFIDTWIPASAQRHAATLSPRISVQLLCRFRLPAIERHVVVLFPSHLPKGWEKGRRNKLGNSFEGHTSLGLIPKGLYLGDIIWSPSYHFLSLTNRNFYYYIFLGTRSIKTRPGVSLWLRYV